MLEIPRVSQHVILIILDGFRPDYLAMYDLPNLRLLTNHGTIYADARGVFPPTTTTNHTSILTGAYPVKTGIPNNSLYNRTLDQFQSPLRNIQVPTLPEILFDYSMTTVEQGHFLLENRKAISYPRGLEHFAHGFSNHRPDLYIYLEMDTDTQGHLQGPYGVKETLQRVDYEIGQIVKHIGDQELLDKTTFIIASDHGMAARSQPTVGSHWQEEILKAGYKVAFTNDEITDETEMAVIVAGSVFFYFRPGKMDAERKAAFIDLLRSVPNTELLTHTELEKLHADSDKLGDVVICPKPGWVMSSGDGGLHGIPETQRTTLILSGAGIVQGRVLGRAHTVDIAPTILSLLGVPIPESVDGGILREALNSQIQQAANY